MSMISSLYRKYIQAIYAALPVLEVVAMLAALTASLVGRFDLSASLFAGLCYLKLIDLEAKADEDAA